MLLHHAERGFVFLSCSADRPFSGFGRGEGHQNCAGAKQAILPLFCKKQENFLFQWQSKFLYSGLLSNGRASSRLSGSFEDAWHGNRNCPQTVSLSNRPKDTLLAQTRAVRIMTAFDLNWEIAKSRSSTRPEKSHITKASQFDLGQLPTHYLCALLYLMVIASVAIYDIYLTFQYRKTLYEMELNPIGRWIMGLDNLKIPGVYPVDPPNVLPFLLLKAAGTVIVLGAVSFLVARWGRIGHGVGIGVSAFQLGLAAFLTFA